MFFIEKTSEFDKWLRKLKDFKEKDGRIIVLLIGGDKSTQQKDIAKAKEIWKKLNK